MNLTEELKEIIEDTKRQGLGFVESVIIAYGKIRMVDPIYSGFPLHNIKTQQGRSLDMRWGAVAQITSPFGESFQTTISTDLLGINDLEKAISQILQLIEDWGSGE